MQLEPQWTGEEPSRKAKHNEAQLAEICVAARAEACGLHQI